MEPRSVVTAEWIEDGFFHPSARLDRDFVDVHEFHHLRLDCIDEDVQFFHIRIGVGNATSDHVVMGSSGLHAREEVEKAIAVRYPEASCVFLAEQREGYARVVAPATITLQSAAAVAVARYSAAWDESPAITIEDGRARYVLHVLFDGERHLVTEVVAG